VYVVVVKSENGPLVRFLSTGPRAGREGMEGAGLFLAEDAYRTPRRQLHLLKRRP
jgi:hypothetical protein